MLLKIKKFLKKNKKVIKIGIVLIIILIILLVLYKALFYSSAESSIYGVRLRDINKNEFKQEEKKKIEKKSSELEKISTVKISTKGRLIKVFINFEEGTTNDIIKQRFNDILGFVSEKVKGYYDITFYAKINVDNKETYPVIGYKHKNKPEISYDEL